MEQRTNEWLEWRNQGVGASEAASIMGVASSFSTPYQIWEIKTKRVVKNETSFAMERGNDLEPIARNHYELMADLDCPPALMVHPTYPYIRASLDGYSAEASVALEIKCPGRADHALAVAGVIPEKYIWQLEQQLLVSQANEAHYFSFDGTDGVLIKYKSDPVKREELTKALVHFWNEYVLKDVPPPLTSRDYLTVTDPTSVTLFETYKEAKQRFNLAKFSLESIEMEIKNTMTMHPKIYCAGVTLSRTEYKGTDGKPSTIRSTLRIKGDSNDS